ncbi:MAG: ferredoxin-type protein NapG [Gammaproteobacteria bacterium]|nr:ferredoxin-type protein NapG [Gammaproteobacteria bacterium]
MPASGGSVARIHGDRRRFLAAAARSACAAGIGGLALSLYARQARSLPANALRPPGAGPQDEFLGACVRCGLCVRACPYDTLRLARPGDGVATGTPYFVAREVPCEMCDDVPCVAACPTGALDPQLTDITAARMGTAVLVDQNECLNLRGLRCDVCYRVCPLVDEAIRLETRHNERTGKHAVFVPEVQAERCTGCGKCEASCVLPEAAIKVLPLALAHGAAAKHYRLGWKEQEKAGAPLVRDLIDLPDRMPESAP